MKNVSKKMRGMIEFIRKGMNRRGDSESDYSLSIGMMVLLIVIILFAFGILITKGSGAIEFIQGFIRGG